MVDAIRIWVWDEGMRREEHQRELVIQEAGACSERVDAGEARVADEHSQMCIAI